MPTPPVTSPGLPHAPLAQPGQIAVLGIDHATPYETGKPSHSAGAPAALRAALTGDGRLSDHYDFDIGTVRPDHAVDCGDVPGDPADPPGNRAAITGAGRALLDAGAVPAGLGRGGRRPRPTGRG